MSNTNHSFTFSLLNYQVCSKCGLITLKNDATRKAIKKPCKGSLMMENEQNNEKGECNK